ncbi:MAG: secretin N-terminal domain-containing protein [Planctomycetaceae bacterium]
MTTKTFRSDTVTTWLMEASLAIALTIVVAQTVSAQQVRSVTIGQDGQPVVVETPVGESQPDANATKGKPGENAKPNDTKSDGDKKKEDEEKNKDDSGKKDEDSGPVKRPMLSSERPSQPIADQVERNDSGDVVFNMKGQSWESVLQWLADASKLSLDWQELPGDTLNLTTTRAYTLEEARDIINRHLLSRGYTMVLNGELLSVLKLSDLKSSLVPRVEPEQLDQMQDHTLCKTSFDLNWLLADEAVQELAPLLSKAGKISKMSRTNRLEVMDTAGTLKDIYHILKNEQSDTGQEQLVKTFRLEHRRANEVIVLLMDLLGLENQGVGGGRGQGGRGGSDMGQLTNVMQQMTQQLQRMGNNQGKAGGGAEREPTKTRLVLNQRENMILAQAMPDQMAIIEKALQQIDVPIEASNSLIQNMNKWKIYRLETVDPQTLVDLLQELGDMSPGTVLKVDSNKISIVAFATLADHLTISTLVERLDQSGRAVEVIHLRRLDAEYVAGTIRALMAPPEKEDTNSRYSYYSRYSSSEEQKTDEKEFKVEPDIENNRLLVYANKVEMDEIMLLLQKLGEIPDPDAVDNGIRVFELTPADEPDKLLQRLKQLWQGDNELQFDLPPAETNPNSEGGETDNKPPAREKIGDDVTRTSPDNQPTGRMTPDQFFALLRSQATARKTPANVVKSATNDSVRDVTDLPQVLTVADEAADHGRAALSRRSNAEPRPPIRFSLAPDGRLVVSSDDKEALLEIEDLLGQLIQPAASYKVFELKYATPSWVTLNLKEYFAAEEETETSMSYDYFFGYRPSTRKKSGTPTLGRRRQPTFIYDNFTSTILVRDADRRQLKVIEDLIQVYDVPEPADTRSMRVTQVFKLQNSRAETVAQAVKDVFRDLLSANDKALEKKDGEKTQTRVYSYFDEGDDGSSDEAPIRFKGLLSIGVDTTSDTLVVSSTASLMETVGELILELDKAAEQTSLVQVIKVDPSVDISLIQERLSKALGTSQQSGPQGNGSGNSNGRNGRENPQVGQGQGQGGE